MPEPRYTPYDTCITLAGGKMVSCPTYAEDGFQVRAENIERATSSRTTGPVVNRRYTIQVLSTVLLRIEFTASDSLQPMGELLPRLSILTRRWMPQHPMPAVYFCCTFPEVASGGRYPLSLPYGARTFLMTELSRRHATVCLTHPLFYRRRWWLSTKETWEAG